MKRSRNVDSDELALLLRRIEYRIDHQTGSHQRLSANISGKIHDLTIPLHKPLRVGILHEILKDVAEHQKICREQIITELF